MRLFSVLLVLALTGSLATAASPARDGQSALAADRATALAPNTTYDPKVPTLKAQLVSANWVGQRRWDLSFQSGETILLPEGDALAGAALVKFAKMDKSAGLLGRGLLRFDLRIPGKMTVRLPRQPGEPIVPEPASEG